MYNYYDAEADYPKDKAAGKFLLTDYFHDSRICSMKYNYKKAEFVLKLQCCRDWERLGKGSIEDKAYRYILRFRGVAGLRQDTGLVCPEYINGRFKKTAWLISKQAQTKKILYQFRIGLSDGFLDIIFHSFQIEKTIGKIRYKDIKDYKAFTIGIEQEKPDQIQKLREELFSGEDSYLDDVRLEKLYVSGADDLVSICRELLKQDRDKDARAYAAWLLGKCGMPSDRGIICQTYQEISMQSLNKPYSGYLMQNRNFLDAIESLTYKL